MKRITPSAIRAAGACSEQADRFAREYPRGVRPTTEALICLAAHGYDAGWLRHLLPVEGPGSQRAYDLWCVEQVAHLSSDPRVAECLAVVLCRVPDPVAVTDRMRAAAEVAAEAAARSAALSSSAAWAAEAAEAAASRAAAGAASRAALWAVAGTAAEAAAEAAQLATLAQLLATAPARRRGGDEP